MSIVLKVLLSLEFALSPAFAKENYGSEAFSVPADALVVPQN
jgi:hypothetical protein